ncbi:hypothetical protein OHB12_15105 [Nocardia sp. NBC_01730]|uniref:hypothetical protein n=1 Tax=Nocardia sp. NBC_01730 TaxID=2975998 RepID=UPI002E15D015|nr:hypothetical protein OHB12_15105 [Nocardia sp. NBC_01730]
MRLPRLRSARRRAVDGLRPAVLDVRVATVEVRRLRLTDRWWPVVVPLTNRKCGIPGR